MKDLNENEEIEFRKDEIVDEEIESIEDEIEEKLNIVVDFISNNFEWIVGAVFTAAIIGGIFKVKNYQDKQHDKYVSSSVNTMNDSYTISDVYVVYNADELWFCNRKLIAINEERAIEGQARRGGGYVSDYYYRDEIYEYYDIKSKEKICQTHEDGFYIESLLDLYTEKDVKAHNYETSIDDLENEINIEDILDRNPGLKRR